MSEKKDLPVARESQPTQTNADRGPLFQYGEDFSSLNCTLVRIQLAKAGNAPSTPSTTPTQGRK